MPAKWKPPECQLRVAEGLPGAGKSFFLVRRTLKIILEEKRPVYTNLPIRFRVFRQYLRNRAGEQYANLITELTDAHWFAFLKRNKAKQEFQQAYKTQCKIDGTVFRRPKFERDWLAHAGPDVLRPGEGVQPNWIPPLAVIIIDEVQHWHPMEKNVKGEDAEGLKAYLTMMRHHLHDVWVASQVFGNVSKAMRDMARQFMRVKSLSDRRLVFNLRLRHFGIRAIQYSLFSKEQIDAQKSSRGETDFGGTPIEAELLYPAMPKNRWIFRLYDSFTHVESPRRMLANLRAVQSDAGITALEDAAKQERIESREDISVKLLRWFMKSIGWIILLGVGLVAGALVNTNSLPGPEDRPDVAAQRVATDAADPWWPHDLGLRGITAKGVYTSDGHVAVGGSYGTGRLRAVDVAERRSLWIVGDGLWLWELGRKRPVQVAGRRELEALNRLQGVGATRRSSPAILDAGPDGGGSLGTPESDAGSP